MYKLYGDGIHDDAPAIQELLDSGISVVALPVPKQHYCIGTTLKIHSGQTLILGRTTKIKLLPHSDCPMLTNAEKAHDIVITGGIWDYDNINQAPNPIRCGKYGPSHADGKADTVVVYTDIYRGSIMRFCGVERFSIHDLTLKNPVTYCIEMACMKYFTVENILFDENLGNPTAENMDGIHIDGGCRFGNIRNVQGTCYDDIVALNADDGYDGPIEDIKIDGVFGENSLRAVRLLSTKSFVGRISISNIYGTFYQNCIGLTYFYPRTGIRGKMSCITINNIFAENAPRRPEYQKKGPYSFSLVWLDGDIDYDHISISNLYRHEKIATIETIKVCKNAKIDTLALSHIYQKNDTGTPIPLIRNEGEIEYLYLRDIHSGDDEKFVNEGKVNHVIE